jgi:hypothetical protein
MRALTQPAARSVVSRDHSVPEPVLPVVRELMGLVMRSRAFTPMMWKTLDAHFDSIPDADLRALLTVIGRYATG